MDFHRAIHALSGSRGELSGRFGVSLFTRRFTIWGRFRAVFVKGWRESPAAFGNVVWIGVGTSLGL